MNRTNNGIPASVRTEGEAHTHTVREEPAGDPLEGLRVVICEDEGVTQMLLRRALIRAGMVLVGTAINGREAVDLALAERPDIVLMDIRMPIMDGLEASRIILSKTKICITILTAFSDPELIQHAHDLGINGYVVKPITAETLLPLLREAYQKFVNGNKGAQ